MQPPNSFNGVITCARYSFAPNYYKYCGPDANKQISSYLKENAVDVNLTDYLSQFDVLYKYLSLIANANGIADPFDSKVVEAYWIGNALLENIKPKDLGNHLVYEQELKKRLPQKLLKWVVEKISKGVKVHHSFHVFNIFVRTGHETAPHTVDTMDQCQIGWGKVVKVESGKSRLRQGFGGQVKVESQRLISKDKKLIFVDAIRDLMFPIDGSVKNKIKPGDFVSFHWGFICDKISQRQVKNLEFYTKHNLRLANETV